MTYKILVSKDKSGGQNAFGKVIKLCGSDSNDIEIFPDATPTLLDGITTYEELKKGYKGTTAFGDLESYTLEEAYLYLDKDQVVLGVGDGTGQKYVRGDYDSIKTLQDKLNKMDSMHNHDDVVKLVDTVVISTESQTRMQIKGFVEIMLAKTPIGMSPGEANAYKTACISILSLIQAQDNEKTNKQRLQQIPGKTSHPEEDSGTSS